MAGGRSTSGPTAIESSWASLATSESRPHPRSVCATTSSGERAIAGSNRIRGRGRRRRGRRPSPDARHRARRRCALDVQRRGQPARSDPGRHRRERPLHRISLLRPSRGFARRRARHRLRQLVDCRRVDYRVKGYRPTQSRLGRDTAESRLAYFNFEWLASSSRSFGFDRASHRAGNRQAADRLR